MLISFTNSSSNSDFNASDNKLAGATVVSETTAAGPISNPGAASQIVAPLPSADQAAETIQIQFQEVQGLASMLNNIKSFQDLDTKKPDIFTDEMWEHYLADTTKMVDMLKASLACGIQGLKDRYHASGDFPSQQSDGSWSQGFYTGSASGSNYSLTADSNGVVSMSKNGGPLTRWSPQQRRLLNDGTSSAAVAINVLKRMLKVNLKI